MTARFLLNLALALGITGVVGCTGATPADKTAGDDDDDDDVTGDHSYYESGTTGPTGFRGDELIAMAFFGYAEIAGGAPGYSVVGAFYFTENWDGDPYNYDESCFLQVEAGESTSGVLDAQPIVPPAMEVPEYSYFYENCSGYFGVDPYAAAYLIQPGSAFAMSAIIDGEMQDFIDNYYGGDTSELTTYWNVPIIKPALSFGVGGGGDADGNQVRASSEVPDGAYFVWGPLVGIDGWFTGTY